jgi:heptaprenyl diphosphate synthase
MAHVPKRMTAAQVASYGVMTALCLVLGYLEVLFPLPVAVPGVKLGLGNLVVLFALVAYGRKPAFVLMLFKVGSSAVLFGNPAVFPFSLAGGILSYAVMALALGGDRFSPLGASVLGGIAHNLGQLCMVALLLGPAIALANLPVLIVAGVITGTAIGLICRGAFKALGTEEAGSAAF